MSALNLFPARIRWSNQDGTLTPEALRMLEVLVGRVGGMLGDSGADVFAAAEPPAATHPDVIQLTPADRALADLVQQLAQPDTQPAELVQQQAPYLPGTALRLVDYHFALNDTAVAPGSYGDSTHVAQFTVDQQGRLTQAQNVAIDFPAPPSGANYSGSLTGKTVTISNGIIISVT